MTHSTASALAAPGRPVPLGLAALTVLEADPLAQIALAEAHDFDTVGFRLMPAAPGTTAYPLHDDPVALRKVAARLADSPVSLFDVEIVRLGDPFDVDDVRPVLAAGAELGARAVLVGGDDRNRDRLIDSYGTVAAACAEYGLVASLEPMPWTAVPDVRAALEIVSAADGPARSVLIDVLHVARSSTTLADVRSIPPEWIHYAQLCDGTVPAPTTDGELIRQAREERFVPGDGGIDVAAIHAALPEGTPVSVEVPNVGQRQAEGTGPWLRRLAAAARRITEDG